MYGADAMRFNLLTLVTSNQDVRFDAERARFSKQQKALEKDKAMFSKKLSNKGFLQNAAPEIIEKDKAKLAGIEQDLQRVQVQLEQLG